jgi:beta-glucosidase
MRLGDLQRSAMRILTIVMQSTPFAELASLQHVSGITVGAYTSQFQDLQPFVTVDKATVKGPTG